MLLTRRWSERAPRETGGLQSGARSGALLAVASAAAIVANYIFLLAAGRFLGSDKYGSLAALLGLLAVVLIPAQALQMAVSREVSRRIASGDSVGSYAFARRTLRLALLGTIPVVALALVLAAPLTNLLNIDSTGVVVLAESSLITAFVAPVALGVLQGSQRFHALAAMYVVPFVLRLGVFAIAAAAGYRLGGAVLATTAGLIGGTVLALALIRAPLGRSSTGSRIDLRPFLRYLAPVAVGLTGIALLTHIDLLIVRARFPGDDAGAYAAASAFARVGLFLPASILLVLFPRTAARHARGEQTEDILGRSILATAAFCAALALFYWAAGVGLVSTTFGPDFREGGIVLAPFAVATGLFSLANILVGYHLSRGETRYAWIVGAGVVAQVVLLAVAPSSLRGVVWTNVSIGVVLLAAHELFVSSSVPALRAGLQRIQGVRERVRVVLPEFTLVLLGTTAFVLALFWPVVVHLSSTVMGTPGSDATGGGVDWLWQLKHETGYQLLGSTHHTMTGAPFGWDQTNAVNVQFFLPYYPMYLLAHVFSEVAALNLITLAGYIFSGASMYFLIRYLGCRRLIATWAALVYIVFPWHIARREHASMLHLEVLVLVVLSLVAAAKKPSWATFAFVGVANLACWLTSGYYGGMAAIATIAFALGAALTTPRRERARLVLGSAASAFVPAALLGLAAIAAGTNAGVGLNRSSGDLSVFGLRPLELVIPPQSSLLFGDRLVSFWSEHTHGSNGTEITNYLGIVTIALAVVWLVIAVRRWSSLRRVQRLATTGLVAVFIAGLLFALPSPISLFGHSVWTPSRLLWEALPAFRVVSRWSTLLMTSLIPLAAFTLQAAYQKLEGRRRHTALPVAMVAVVTVLSFLELATHPASPRFRTVPVPPEYAAVERTRPGILAEYPLGSSDVYRLWQREHGRPILNGSPPGSPGDYARLVLLDPADPGTAQKLSLLGVTAIGIHPGARVDAEVLPHDPTPGEGYRLVGRFPDGASIWEVDAPPAGALVTLPGGFAKPMHLGSEVGYPLISTAGVGVIEIAARTPRIVRLSFVATPPNGGQRALRVTDSHSEQAFTLNGRTAISVLVAVPRGKSLLLVKTDPAPTSAADAIVFTAPRAVRSSEQAALRADSSSADPGF